MDKPVELRLVKRVAADQPSAVQALAEPVFESLQSGWVDLLAQRRTPRPQAQGERVGAEALQAGLLVAQRQAVDDQGEAGQDRHGDDDDARGPPGVALEQVLPRE